MYAEAAYARPDLVSTQPELLQPAAQCGARSVRKHAFWLAGSVHQRQREGETVLVTTLPRLTPGVRQHSEHAPVVVI
jgi:hypothetical protein